MQPHPLDIHDLITQLTRTHTHREPYARRDGNTTWTAGHVTTVPALIHQLLNATPASSGEEAGGGGATSRPAARIEAVDTLMLIDDEAARWVRHLGENDPADKLDHHGRPTNPGSGTIACLQLLHALHARQKQCDLPAPRKHDSTWCCTAHHIEADTRRWWRQARVISGWDSPAWRPNNTCPVCDQRRSLRINLTLQAAFCVECRIDWGPEDIGLLAEWIRTENADTDDTPDTDADTDTAGAA